MWKIVIVIFIIGILITGFFWMSKKDYPITNFPAQGKTIVAFGDSLVSGVGSTPGKDFVSLLSAMTGEQIINMGVPGETTLGGLARIEKVNELDPKVVMVLLGGNDFLRRVSMEETFKNLEEIVKKLQEGGAVVVILGVRGGIISDQFDQRFEEVAEKNGALYVPNVLDGLFREDEFMSDSIHPNNAGYQKIAEKVYPVLKKALGK